MSISLEVLSDIVDAAPGHVAQTAVRIHNDAATDTVVSLSVVGVGDQNGVSLADVDVPAGASVDQVVAIPIPEDIAVGQHSAALRAVSTHPGERPALAPFTVSVESVQKVSLIVEPSTIRGRRTAKFVLGVGNDEPTPVAFTLAAEAQDVRVKFRNSAFRLLPGQRAATRGKVRGPRHLVGEPIQHNLVVAAQGKASASTITTPFIQRPLFAAKARALVAGVAVIALWIAAIGGVALWVSSRNDDSAADLAASSEDAALVRLVDANGEVLDNGPYTVMADGSIVDADGNAVDGFELDENGNIVDDKGNPVNGVQIDDENMLVDQNGTPIGLPPSGDGSGGGAGGGGDGTTADGGPAGSDGAGASGDDQPTGIVAPRFTLIRGSVSAEGTEDLSDVTITLATIDLGAEPTPGSTVVDPPGAGQGSGAPDGTGASKLWPARYAPMRSDLGAIRQTQPVPPLEVTAGVDGVWQIPNVALRRTYELRFAKPGFDTRSFVISPPDDGAPVELDVTLEPGRGLISGTVFDGGRPLGGVAVAISDGTLTFTTTSSTDGDVGTFSFDGISTPGVYTLTATRAGYGTEVLQLPMSAGQQRTGTDITMSAGVGTVSGSIVSESGAPLGGVTITASNGEVSRTTTSLTDGNTGFYSIPQLDVPNTYTVTVQFPGFLPQTRRVPMGGSVGGVSFALINTTTRLTGTVTSAGGGGGVVAAGVTLSNADLKFEVATAASPPGAYAVDDLPPGNYTVTIDHFQHDTVTEFIELRAGVDPPPLNIVLPLRTKEFDPGTGSLVVEAVDPGAENAEERQIKNATVQLIRTRTGEIERTVTQEAFDFRITDIPVGTYTVLVTALGYNPAAPRQVSIGRSEERRTIELQRLGQATGRVIDSITKQPVNQYAISIFSQNQGGGELFVTRVVVGSDSVDGIWETERNALRTGIYRASFTSQIGVDESPPGYAVRNDQDLGLPQDMFFEIPANVVEAVEIPDIEADPYPNILGQVYKPFYDNPGIRFEPIDDPTLKVSMACGGGAPVSVPVSDETGLTNPAKDVYDSFYLDKNVVDANDLIGACELIVEADDYVTQTVPLTDVAISNGIVLSDRVVNPALHKPVDRLGGTVFWVDDRFGTELPLPDVDISATAITRFDPGRKTPEPPAPPPADRSETIVATSGAGGAWEIAGQIFGKTQYTFLEDGFGAGIIEVVIDETDPRTVTEVQGVNLSQSGTSYKVELEPPKTGKISGRVDIVTTDATRTPLYDEVGIAATNPFNQVFDTRCDTSGNPAGLCIVRDASSPVFEVPAADAGTWTTTFTQPDNHVLFNGAPSFQQFLLGPEEQRGGFDTTYVELGELDVLLFDDNGTELNTPAELVLTAVPNNSFPTVSDTFAGGDGAGNNLYELAGIAVHPTTPLSTSVRYNLDVRVGGFDQTTAAVTVKNASGTVIATQTGSSVIPLDYLAGSKPVVEVKLESFGEIVADVTGQLRASPSAEEDLTIADGLVVTANRVAGPNDSTVLSSCTVPSGTSTCGLIGIRQVSPGQIAVSGPEGHYTISVSHPQYEDTALATPTDTGVCNPFCQTSNTPGVIYELVNDQTNTLSGEFRLDLRDSAIDITVLESLDTGSPGYPIDVTEFSYDVLEEQSGNWVSIVSGTATGNNVNLPIRPSIGNYRIEIRKFVNSVETRYPAIVEIPLQRSTGATTGTGLYTLTIKAPLAALGSSISATLVGQNQTDPAGPVDLPVIQVSRDYAEQQIEADGSLVANTCDETRTDLQVCFENQTSMSTVQGPTADQQVFSFTGLPSGSHTFTFSVPPGYTATFDEDNSDSTVTFTVDVGPNEAIVACPTPASTAPPPPSTTTTPPAATANCVPTLIYTAAATTVTAEIKGTVSNEIFPTLEARLIPPGGDWLDGTIASFTPDANGADNQQPIDLTFSGISPHRDDYTLEVRDALHTTYDTNDDVTATYTKAVAVNVDAANDGETIGTHTPPALRGRLSGTAQIVSNGTPGPIGPNTVITVTGPDPSTTQHTFTGDGSGVYEFILEDGQYDVSMVWTAPQGDTRKFTTATATVVVNKGLGTVENLSITQAASYSITIQPYVPAGLVVEVVQYNNGTDGAAFPAAQVGATQVFEANVPAGTYRVRVSGGGLASPIYQPTVGETVTAGASKTLTITIPRKLTVFIDDNGNERRDVKVYNTSDTLVASKRQRGGNVSDRTFSFVEGTSGTQIPSTGDLYIVVSRVDSNERRSIRENVPDDLQANVSVDLLELVDVEGTVKDPSGTALGSGITVTASSSAGSDITDNTDGSGLYQIDDLHNAATGGNVTWTLTVDEKGLGYGTTTQAISGTDPADNLVTGKDITVTPRNLTITVPVEDSLGDPLAGAKVERFTSGGTAIESQLTALDTGSGDAIAVFSNIPENFDGYFAVTKQNYQSETDGGGPYTTYNATQMSFTESTVVLQPVTTSVTFDVTYQGTTAPGATITLTPTGASSTQTTATYNTTTGKYDATINQPGREYNWTITPPPGFTASPSSGTTSAGTPVPEIDITLTAITETIYLNVTPTDLSPTITLTNGVGASITFTGSSGSYQATVKKIEAPFTWTATKTDYTTTYTNQTISVTEINGSQTQRTAAATLAPVMVDVFLDLSGPSPDTVTLSGSSGPITPVPDGGNYKATVAKIHAPFTWTATRADHTTTYSPDQVISPAEINGNTAARTVAATLTSDLVEVYLDVTGGSADTVSLTGSAGAVTPVSDGSGYKAVVNKNDAPFVWNATKSGKTATWDPADKTLDATDLAGNNGDRTVKVTFS